MTEIFIKITKYVLLTDIKSVCVGVNRSSGNVRSNFRYRRWRRSMIEVSVVLAKDIVRPQTNKL